MSNVTYINQSKTIKIFQYLTIKNIQTNESIDIEINHVSHNNEIEWVHTDKSRIFAKTKNNWFNCEIGHQIIFHRNSQKDFKDIWKIIHIEFTDKTEEKGIFSYN